MGTQTAFRIPEFFFSFIEQKHYILTEVRDRHPPVCPAGFSTKASMNETFRETVWTKPETSSEDIP